MRDEFMHEGMRTGDMTMGMQRVPNREVFPLRFRIRCHMYGTRIKGDVLANDVALVGFNSDTAVC